uniref:Uncharacterized protein n=1 Tax=Arundo donax TaxID=35708 RepID=A0A0A9FEN1_ARUDO
MEPVTASVRLAVKSQWVRVYARGKSCFLLCSPANSTLSFAALKVVGGPSSFAAREE